MLRARVATAGVLLIGWVSTVNAAPCAGFTDVDNTSPFCVNVAWMKNRGITLGLTPTLYDPNSPVTRLQMAAFMYRLGYQNAFLQGGNTFGATAVLGTTDTQPVDIIVNNFRRMRYDTNGNILALDGTVGNDVFEATIAGGLFNHVTASRGTISGGAGNQAHFHAVVGGGVANLASGSYSTVLGGTDNVAAGFASIAAGIFANANANDCAVFSLWGGVSPGMPCFGVPSTFNIGATNGMTVDYFSKRPDGGGMRWVNIGRFAGQTIATWTGAGLNDAGVWFNASDAANKKAYEEIDKRDVLEKLAALPIRSWRYQVESDKVRHIGPTAQDFMAAFRLGHDDKAIGTIDADGVALAAIQGLNAKVEDRLAAKDAEIAMLRTELAEIRALLAERR